MKIPGLGYASGAILLWGSFPLFFKQLEHIDLYTIMGYRMVWAAVFMFCVMAWMGKLAQLREAFSRPGMLGLLAVTSALLGVCWVVYVWAVLNGLIIEASLGYFLTPIISVIFGLTIFRERMSRLQGLAVTLAALGVLCRILVSGVVPWIGLMLGGSFALYSALRKRVSLKPFCGSFVESLYLLPFGIILILASPQWDKLSLEVGDLVLLVLSGIITILPLAWYICAAKVMPLVVLGTLFYLAPTLGFLSGVFIFDEPFTTGHGIMFSLILSGLAVFTWDSVRSGRKGTAAGRKAPSKYQRL